LIQRQFEIPDDGTCYVETHIPEACGYFRIRFAELIVTDSALNSLGRKNGTLRLDLFRALGHKLGIANAIEELGAVRAVQGDGVQAAMLFSTAHALREGMGAPLPPVDRAAYDSVVAVCRAQLGETAFDEAWARAAARPFQEVVEEVLKLRS
jgi:hypothetical protein